VLKKEYLKHQDTKTLRKIHYLKCFFIRGFAKNTTIPA